MGKVLIVEGPTDVAKLQPILSEPVEFIKTYGTLSRQTLSNGSMLFGALDLERLEDEEDVYIFVDADRAGESLRRMLRNFLPGARHLYTERRYREVAETPAVVLAHILMHAYFEVNLAYVESTITNEEEHRLYLSLVKRERRRM